MGARLEMMKRLLILSVLALSACGNMDKAATGSSKDLTKTLISLLRPNKALPPVMELNRAILAGITDPLIRIELGERPLIGYYYIALENGERVTWASTDRTNFTTQGGILIATRGLAGDLMQSDTSAIRAALRGGQAGAYRRHTYLGGDNKLVTEDYTCRITDNGTTTITVLERQHRVRHISESCQGAGHAFVNEYWHGQGVMWKSRQWTGPVNGMLQIERLIE
jgi:hypothetical protein